MEKKEKKIKGIKTTWGQRENKNKVGDLKPIILISTLKQSI